MCATDQKDFRLAVAPSTAIGFAVMELEVVLFRAEGSFLRSVDWGVVAPATDAPFCDGLPVVCLSHVTLLLVEGQHPDVGLDCPENKVQQSLCGNSDV